MLIDWFTVIAQAINFLVLVWLLKRFLYKPVLKAIAEREKGIADQVRMAGEKEAEAQQAKEQYRQLNEKFSRERESLLQQAEAEAMEERARLLEAGRKEYDELRARLKETMEKEQDRTKEEVAQRMETEVFAVARKLLADLADTTLETQMVRVFIRRLRELPEKEGRVLQAAWNGDSSVVQSGDHPEQPRAAVLVRSAFDLSPDDRLALEKALKEKLATGLAPSFEIRTGLVSGIELAVNGFKLSWGIGDYLAALEKNIPHGNSTAIPL